MKARIPVAVTVAAVLIGSIAFGGAIGAWSVFGPKTQAPAEVGSSSSAPNCGTYVNRDGHAVPRPCGNSRTDPAPPNSSALCRDGSYSFSEHRQGTCSH